MLARKRMLWVNARDSLWLIPSALTLVAAALALVLIRLERLEVVRLGTGTHWLLGGGTEGARAVLSTISTGLITVTGVVFSVTIVALQLASSQFTPRLLRNFTANRTNQVVMGVFISTFTYALIVLRVVESGADGFVPRVAVAVGLVLFLVSVALLVFFIHHASRSIRITVILEHLTRDTVRHIVATSPLKAGASPAEAELESVPGDPHGAVTAEVSGYLQGVDVSALFQLGREQGVLMRMEQLIGEYVLPGRPLVSVWPAESVNEELTRGVRRGFVLGEERTPEQDVEFGIIEISDIAVKALSPGINDPRTASHCIDRLADILYQFGTRAPPANLRAADGRLHFIYRPLTFERALGLAFDQILHFGVDNPTITRKLVDVLGQLLQISPVERREALQRQRDAVVRASGRQLEHPGERAEPAGA